MTDAHIIQPLYWITGIILFCQMSFFNNYDVSDHIICCILRKCILGRNNLKIDHPTVHLEQKTHFTFKRRVISADNLWVISIHKNASGTQKVT